MKLFIIVFICCSTLLAGNAETSNFIIKTNLPDTHALKIGEWAEHYKNHQSKDYGVSTRRKSHKIIIEYTYGRKESGIALVEPLLSKPSIIKIESKDIDTLLYKSLPHEINHVLVREYHMLASDGRAFLLEGLAFSYESKQLQKMSDERLIGYKRSNKLYDLKDFSKVKNTNEITDIRKKLAFYDHSRSFTIFVRNRLSKEKFRLLVASSLYGVDFNKSFEVAGLNYSSLYAEWISSLK